MKPGIPWSVKGIEPEAREAAKRAARRAGLTLGEWLNSVIFDQSEHIVSGTQADSPAWDNFVSSTPKPNPDLSRSEPARSESVRPEPLSRAAPSRAAAERRDDSVSRLQDIAQQLASLAQQDRNSAPPPAFERARPGEIERILERVEDNERQTVEALSAVNDRLSMLGRQISQLGRPAAFERPEDVPGYAALEQAIRNVVEHIEVSEKRTRDSLRVMQDRLAEMAERRSAPPSGEDILRAVPMLSGLEQRFTDIQNRIQRSEGVAAERMESLKASAQQMANQAQSSAVTAARGELREVETRVLASLKEAQATAASTPSTVATEIARLHGDVVGLGKRFDDLRGGVASERDLQSLRGALEQLSARVAQGPDLRPLADMDKRLGDITRRLEQAGREHPRMGPLEQRVIELDHRLAEVIRLQGDQNAVRDLEESIAAVGARLAHTEKQLGHIESIEQAIRHLHDSLDQTRRSAGDVADAAASRAIERIRAGAPSGPSPELRALEEGLRAVRETAASSERRNRETFDAVHETLSDIVRKIASLEAQPAATPEPPQPAARFAAPDPDPEPAPPPSVGMPNSAGAAAPGPAEPLLGGDDFIAAARRAAQAAASRPSALRAEYAVLTNPPQEKEEAHRPSFLDRLRGKRRPAAPDAAPAAEAVAAASQRSSGGPRKALIVAGILLLAAASFFAYRSLSGPPPASPSVQNGKPSASLAQTGSALSSTLSDPIVTGSLPSAAAPVTAAVSSAPLQLPPPEAGPEALRRAAARGDARAQFIVAGRYLEGRGPVQDYDKAFFWYQQSAASGLAPAQYRLGTLYQLGRGTAADAARALAWYERAAAGGNVRAMHNAAVLAAGDKAGAADFDKAFHWFSAAAARGFRDSQFNLAILFERGLGTRASPKEAYVWYTLAARQGDRESGKRSAELAKVLSDADLKEADARLAAWKPTPSDDAGNVVTVIDASWRDPQDPASSG